MTRSTTRPSARQHPDPHWDLHTGHPETRRQTAERMGRTLGPDAATTAYELTQALQGEDLPQVQVAILSSLTRLAQLGGEALFAAGQGVRAATYILRDTEDGAARYEADRYLDTVCDEHNRAVAMACAQRNEYRTVSFGLPVHMRDEVTGAPRKTTLTHQAAAAEAVRSLRGIYGYSH